MPADILEAMVAIRTRFNDDWEALHPGMPIVYQNDHFTGDDEEWVRLRIAYQRSRHHELRTGATVERGFRMPGDVIVEIYSAPHDGHYRPTELQRDCQALFRGRPLGEITFWEPYEASSRTTEDGAYYRTIMLAPFHFDIRA